MAGYVTTHVLDTALGLPARGITVELFKVNSDTSVLINSAITNSDGRLDSPILSKKNLGVLIVRNKIKKTIGIITDGDLKRAIEKNSDLNKLKLNKIMTKNPISIDQNELAAKALNLMTSKKKITSLCVFKNNKKDRTIGIIHIHNILNANIN